MAENGEQIIWGIHAGRTGDAETLFLKKHFVALGWPQVGDLSKVWASHPDPARLQGDGRRSNSALTILM
jgi:hypothetical protein